MLNCIECYIKVAILLRRIMLHTEWRYFTCWKDDEVGEDRLDVLHKGNRDGEGVWCYRVIS